ncbi:MAG: hypothetical protein MI740_18895 [Halanaerobiales bacterium]|nr:hypothetical protein [Halanaerobiales bacterium]
MRNFACLGIRLLLIYFFIGFIQYILSLVGMVGFIINQPNASFLEYLFMLILPLLYFLLFYFLWKYSDQLSAKIIKEDEAVVFNSEFDFDKLKKVLYSLTGIILLFLGVGGLAKNILYLMINTSKTYIPEILEDIIFIIVGISLLTKLEQIFKSLKKLFSNIEQD